MICQAIYTSVVAAMSSSTQATTSLPDGRGDRGGQGGGGMGDMYVLCGEPKQVTFPGNCYRCGKVGHYVWDCTYQNTYWDPPPFGTEDTATKVNHNKGSKLYVTM